MASSRNSSGGNGYGTGPGPGWSERLARLADAIQSLVATRLEIFEAEAGAKARLFGKGLAGAAVAAAFAFGATLLLAALLAAALAQLFGNAALGILGALVAYLAVAAGAGYWAWKSFSRVEPTEFPATRRELARDAEAIRTALAQEPDPEEGPSPEDDSLDEELSDSEGDVRDLEARIRAAGVE